MSKRRILKDEIAKLKAIKQTLKREFDSPLSGDYWISVAIDHREEAIDCLDDAEQG